MASQHFVYPLKVDQTTPVMLMTLIGIFMLIIQVLFS